MEGETVNIRWRKFANKITFKNISLNYQVESTSTLGFYLNSQNKINNFGLGEGLNAAADFSRGNGGNGAIWK